MKWLKRGCWIAAWGVWLWLGFGLYRELPRDLGPEVGRVSLGKESLIGFVGGSELLATCRIDSSATNLMVRVRNVERDELLHASLVPYEAPWGCCFSARDGVIIGRMPDGAKDAATRHGALDLRTGRWTDLGAEDASFGQFHPERPWVTLLPSGNKDGMRVVVADFRTGQHLFEWKGTKSDSEERGLNGRPLFLPKRDAILVPVSSVSRSPFRWRQMFEVWKIGDGSLAPEQVLDGPDIGISASLSFEASASTSTRVAWTEIGTDPISVQVFDAEQGKIVFSHPPDAKRLEEVNLSGSVPQSTLSPDGRAVLFEGILWEVDTGKALWMPSRLEPQHRCGATTLTIEESWSRLLGDWAETFSTWAIRDLSTGRVKYRLWITDDEWPTTDSDFIDAAKQVCIDRSGAIRTYPPPVNYPLLALCQTILALPLILLWAVLSWRRKRRLKS